MLNLLKSLLFPNLGRKGVSPETLEKIKQDWQNIEILLKGKSPSQLHKAIITADKTLDNALKDMVPGETMGERLKNAKDKYDRHTYDKIWKAHKLRNKMVHETGFEAPYYAIIGAVDDLKMGLQALGVRV